MGMTVMLLCSNSKSNTFEQTFCNDLNDRHSSLVVNDLTAWFSTRKFWQEDNFGTTIEHKM
jgi:hypothetical protein